jgi:hypothetical protein
VEIVRCPRHIWGTQNFGIWPKSQLQMISFYYTEKSLMFLNCLFTYYSRSWDQPWDIVAHSSASRIVTIYATSVSLNSFGCRFVIHSPEGRLILFYYFSKIDFHLQIRDLISFLNDVCFLTVSQILTVSKTIFNLRRKMESYNKICTIWHYL